MAAFKAIQQYVGKNLLKFSTDVSKQRTAIGKIAIRELNNDACQLLYKLPNSIKLENLKTTDNVYRNEIDLRNFMATFPHLVNELLTMKRYFSHPVIADRTRQLLNYTVPDGKRLRAITFFALYRSMLSESTRLNENELYQMYIMGWCLELYQAFLIVMDDILDNSTERRGRKCWHLQQTSLAMNDCSLLNDLIYLVLQNHFRDKNYYVNVMELFHDISIRTINAQTLDVAISCIAKKSNKFDSFSMDIYRKLAMNKTSYQAFVCPFETAVLMTGVRNTATLQQNVRNILLEIGVYYQVQNDYNDCFGSSTITGRIGEDIETGKCTWLILTALKYATEAQRKMLEDCYATNNENAVTIKEIYEDLRIPELYCKYEEDTGNWIESQINNLPNTLPRDIFRNIYHTVRNIYNK